MTTAGHKNMSQLTRRPFLTSVSATASMHTRYKGTMEVWLDAIQGPTSFRSMRPSLRAPAYGYPLEQQILIFAGTALLDDRTLLDYGIDQFQDALFLVLRRLPSWATV